MMEKRGETRQNAGRTLEVLLNPILVYTLWQDHDSALDVPRDDDLSGGNSQLGRNFLDLGVGILDLAPVHDLCHLRLVIQVFP